MFRSARFTIRTVAAAAFVGVVSAAGTAVAEKEGFTPEHVAKLRSVTTAVISPNGKHIAYALSVPRRPFEDDDGPAWRELHVVDQAGHSRPFVTGEVNVSALKWTPDSSGISFLAKRGQDEEEHKALYVIPLDGGEARKVLSRDTDITAYTWSPDGKRVAFIAAEKIPKDRKERKEKGFKQEIYEEDWQQVRVWVGVPDEEDAEPRKLDLAGTPSQLHWSPVANQLALALAPTPLIDDHYMKRRVHVVDADSGETIARIDNPGKLGQIAWSPDGKHLAVISGEDGHDPSAGRLMVAAIDRSRERIPLRDLLPGYEGEVRSIAWQDPDTVMFLGAEGVWSTLGEVGRDGTGRKTHLPAGRMVLAGLTLSRNGRSMAAVGQSPMHPGEVFTMSHGEPAPRRLTNSNPWLEDVRLAPQEVVTYKARDGLAIEGLLIRPLDEQAGKRYPLILSVHGGPESHHPNGWLTRYSGPGQVAAARGFAVFYINYRGSTGRGVAFSKMGQADYAGKEFDDLVDGVDHLVETGLVDRDRVGVTGGSYGGFASAWCATYYSERFAASVMFVGLSDHVSKFGTTDIPNEMTMVHARKYPWEDWDFFRKRSPIYHAQKARTPILILHGKDDPRVNPGQSRELYRYLKTLGNVPVRLIFYPGEGHGNRKAAARYDYNLRMMRWFEHYLKGPGGDAPDYELPYPLEPSEDEDEDADAHGDSNTGTE